jgi:S1-C subfamily serine protease
MKNKYQPDKMKTEGVRTMAKNELVDLSNAMAQAVEKAGKSTVLVNGRRRLPASGITLSRQLVLTANHVVERDEDLTIILPDGTELSAEIAGRDPGSDLVLLKLEKEAATPAKANGSPKIGQLILALGRPSKEGIQASLGIVSAISGPTRTRMGSTLEQHIRTDAIPYPGFSGGPLIDAEGKVIGINTSGLGHGNSIAIPIDLALKIADSLEKHGSVKRGYLGIRSQLVEIPEKAELGREQETGLLVISLEEDSPAEEAELMTGDIIIGFNNQPVEDHEALFAVLTGEVVGQPAPLEILRGGKLETLEVTVSERAEAKYNRRGRGMMFPGHFHGAHFGRKFSKRRTPRPFRRRHSRRRHHGQHSGDETHEDSDE